MTTHHDGSSEERLHLLAQVAVGVLRVQLALKRHVPAVVVRELAADEGRARRAREDGRHVLRRERAGGERAGGEGVEGGWVGAITRTRTYAQCSPYCLPGRYRRTYFI